MIDGAGRAATGFWTPRLPPASSMSAHPQGLLRPGEVVRGTYLVVAPLGQGGMGEVYEVEHARLSGRYALKLLRRERAADPEAVDRFRREAEIASGLRHPHIVQVIDFDTLPGGAPFLVMERLEGEDLKTHLRARGPLSLARVVAIVEQIASGLAAAHERGIVHRDLKPENLFLTRVPGQDGDFVKILDFGISKVRAATTRLTGDRTVLGTPHYMAPEQARGKGDDVDGRTDEFALGAIAYEALTGEEAFRGEDASAVLYQVVHETPARLAGPAPLVSAAVDRVLGRALAKDRAERFASVKDFARALADAAVIAAGLGAGAGAGAARDTLRVGREPARRRAWVALGAAVAAAALGVLGWHVATRTAARDAGPREPAAPARPDPAAPAATASAALPRPPAVPAEPAAPTSPVTTAPAPAPAASPRAAPTPAARARLEGGKTGAGAGAGAGAGKTSARAKRRAGAAGPRERVRARVEPYNEL
jgi:serine/threonine-protein kinase